MEVRAIALSGAGSSAVDGASCRIPNAVEAGGHAVKNRYAQNAQERDDQGVFDQGLAWTVSAEDSPEKAAHSLVDPQYYTIWNPAYACQFSLVRRRWAAGNRGPSCYKAKPHPTG